MSAERFEKNIRYWLCRCECGTEKEVGQRNLVNKKSTCCLRCAGKNLTKTSRRNHQLEDGSYIFPGNGVQAKWWMTVRQEQFQKQNGICPICLRPLKSIRESFDHNHRTNKCRELVHRGCNVLIGFAENHPGILNRVKEYLQRHE